MALTPSPFGLQRNSLIKETFKNFKTMTADTALTDQNGKPVVTVWLWVGGAGDLVVVGENDQTVTFVGISGWCPIAVKQYNSSGTTATSIVGCW